MYLTNKEVHFIGIFNSVQGYGFSYTYKNFCLPGRERCGITSISLLACLHWQELWGVGQNYNNVIRNYIRIQLCTVLLNVLEGTFFMYWRQFSLHKMWYQWLDCKLISVDMSKGTSCFYPGNRWMCWMFKNIWRAMFSSKFLWLCCQISRK